VPHTANTRQPQPGKRVPTVDAALSPAQRGGAVHCECAKGPLTDQTVELVSKLCLEDCRTTRSEAPTPRTSPQGDFTNPRIGCGVRTEGRDTWRATGRRCPLLAAQRGGKI